MARQGHGDGVTLTPSQDLEVTMHWSRALYDWYIELFKEELERMPGHIRRMRSTIDGSHGIVQGKTAKGLDMDEEVAKWKAEFGDEGGVKVEKWVRAAMPDYEYMRAKRLAA